MAVPRLTVRNLTVNAVELKLVERFEAPKSAQNPDEGFTISNITRSISGLMGNSTEPSSPELALKAESFSHQDVSIRVGAFETKATDVQPNANEILRLTFDVEGQKYRIDTPTPSSRSSVFKCLAPNPKFQFTGIYLPKSSYLAIFSSAKLESWMGNFKDQTPLSALSIPGTHNSPTCYTALPSVRCQAVGVKEQLDNGVRFLDLRVQPEDPENPEKDGLVLVHSAFPISLTGSKYFRDVVNTVIEFLNANRSETVIVSVKREGTGKSTDQQLSKILHDHYYSKDSGRWFTQNRIPDLGEARNKIVLMRRFGLDDSLKGLHGGKGWGIDAQSWPDNCADGLCGSGEIRIQDFYEVAETENIDKKIELSRDHLARAAESICTIGSNENKQPFFMNFLSASNFWRANCWPDKVAGKVNPEIVDFLCRRHNESTGIGCEGHQGQKKIGDGGTGIVVCDWVGNNGDWDLVRCIVGMNARLESKARK